MNIQILITILILFAISRIVFRVLHDRTSLVHLYLWGGLWVCVLIATWSPWILGELGRLLGVGRGVDVLIYVGILVLYYLVYRIYAFIQNQEKRITKLVRSNAKDNVVKV